MFERRLKIFLLILGLAVGGLLVRAAQLQIVERDYWKKQASEELKKVKYLETDRGAIVDRKGRELAADRPCVDACVDYQAIIHPADPKWLHATAARRLKNRMGDAWSHTPKKQREKLCEQEAPFVQKDIDAMWDRLAEVSGKPREDIERTRQDILQMVELRKRLAWYKAYASATEKGGGTPDQSTIEKWLEPGSNEGAPIDNFTVNIAEESTPHIILHAIGLDVQNELGRHSAHYPGLSLRPGLHRYYPYEDVACHIIGHLGKVGAEDMKDHDPNYGNLRRQYFPNDDIGRGGLEWLCEPALRGTLGRVTSVTGESSSQTTDQPVPGQTVHTTIDIDLQQDIQNFFASATLHDPHGHPNAEGEYPILEDHAILHGAAVLLDVQTNQVLAMVSYPTYDLNHFDDLYAKLKADPIEDKLRDRATESQLEPGSTVKPLVGLSAITAGVMKVNEGIECTGYLVLPVNGKPRTFLNGRCWVASGFAQQLKDLGMTPAHHPIPFPHKGHDGNLDGFLTYSDALERSCNVYFETVADRMGRARLHDWMDRFGLGRRTGIGIEEYKGRVPGPNEHFGNPRAINFFAGIGQGYVAATPIQMANVAATIARGGIWMRPHLIETDPATGKLPPVRPRALDGPDVVDLHLDPQGVAAARQGMINVVDAPAGTGKMAHMSNMLIAGKTGTAQAAPFRVVQHDEQGQPMRDEKGHYVHKMFQPSTPDNPNAELPWYRGTGTKDNYKLDHAWMIGFAPADHPKIAFAVLVEYGGSGGGAAADVVKFSLDDCIAHGYLQPQINKPKPQEEQSQQASAAPAPQATLPAGSELLTDMQGQR